MQFTLESVGTLADAEARLSLLVRAARPETMSRVNVLVGSNLQRLSMRRVLASRLGPTANVRFFTPVDLAAAVRDRGPGVARQALPDGADTLLVDGILRELATEGALRRLQPGVAGVAEAVASSLTDLREAHLSSDGFARALRRPDDPKLHELAKIYARYETLIARFRDRTSLYEDALDPLLPDDAVRAALGGGPLIVAGIYDVPMVQLQLLRRVAAVADVHVVLVRDPARPALEFAEEFASLLIGAGATAGRRPPATPPSRRGATTSAPPAARPRPRRSRGARWRWRASRACPSTRSRSCTGSTTPPTTPSSRRCDGPTCPSIAPRGGRCDTRPWGGRCWCCSTCCC